MVILRLSSGWEKRETMDLSPSNKPRGSGSSCPPSPPSRGKVWWQRYEAFLLPEGECSTLRPYPHHQRARLSRLQGSKMKTIKTLSDIRVSFAFHTRFMHITALEEWKDAALSCSPQLQETPSLRGHVDQGKTPRIMVNWKLVFPCPFGSTSLLELPPSPRPPVPRRLLAFLKSQRVA